MKINSNLCIAVLALVATVGCLRVPAGVAPSNTPLEARSYNVIGDAFGRSTHVSLFGIIPISSSNHTAKAIEAAKNTSGGDALIDVTVESVSKYFILFSTYTTEVRGKAIKFNAALPAVSRTTPVAAPVPVGMGVVTMELGK